MYIKQKLKNTYKNFTVRGFLRTQKPGKHPLSTESGATGMGKWAQAFGGTGLLEMNIGRNGISMQLGMNGIDVGGALYDLGKRSYDRSMLQRYEREHGKDKGEAAYSAYVYGDWTQEHTAARLASGKDELYFTKGKEYTAKTSNNGKGGRRIEITDSKDRRLNAIQLGHEAYRDGRVGGNNAQETIAAVLGHTGMAVRMEADGKRVAGSDLLRAEMEAYKRGDMDALLMNALTNYDSTDDYWKLTHGGQLVNDGQGWLKDENGKYINIDGTRTDEPIEGKTLGARGIETGLLNLLGGTSGKAYTAFTPEEKAVAQQLMNKAGMQMDKNGYWYALDENKKDMNKGKRLTMYDFMNTAGEKVNDTIFDTYYNNTVDSHLAKAWGVDLGFERNHAVPEALAGKYSDLVFKHVLAVRNPTGLKNKYKFTVYDKNNKGIELFKIDKNNPFLDDVLGQHDFRGINSAIDNEGCNFMTILAYSQLLTGKVFSESAIMNIWDQAITQKNNFVRSTDALVNNRELLSDLAWKQMNINNFQLDFNGGTPRWRDVDVYRIGQRLGYKKNIQRIEFHFGAGDIYDNTIYNPGYAVTPFFNTVPVDLYVR